MAKNARSHPDVRKPGRPHTRGSRIKSMHRVSALVLAFLVVFQYSVVGMGMAVWAADGSEQEVSESAEQKAEAEAEAKAKEKAEAEAKAKAEAEAEAKAAAEAEARAQAEAEAKAAEEAARAEAEAEAEAKAAEEARVAEEAAAAESKEEASTEEAEAAKESSEEKEAEAVKEESDKSADADKKEKKEKEDYPAFSDSGSVSGMTVKVSAPEGALPKGTKVKFAAVSAGSIQGAVESVVGEDAKVVKAADITFFNKDGKEIEPKKAVSVSFGSSSFKGLDDPSVVHISDGGSAEIVNANITNSSASFKASDFSVYAVVEGAEGEDARLTVKFVKADGSEVSMMVTKRQLDGGHLNTYIYDPGVGTVGEDELFKGWTDVQNYTASTDSKTIADVRTQVAAMLNAGVKEGDSITFYAMIFKSYKIAYRDEKGVTIKTDQLLFPRTAGNEQDYTVNLAYTPYAKGEDGDGATADFIGWQQISPEVEGQEIIYSNEQSIKVSSSMILKAVVHNGYWLSFNENLRNATYTAPVFYEKGTTPARPANPTRVGYTFGGWYTEDASEARDGEVAGTEFDFSKPLTASTTVHAKWTRANTASYSVIIWKQNVAGTGYDYGETITVNNGTVGQTVNTVSAQGSGNNSYARINGSNYQYTGFHLKEFDTDVTINAEGNTVVNVYYDRTQYTFTFQIRSGNNWTTIKTITARYEENIASNFPIVGTNGVTYNNGERWMPTTTTPYDNVMVFVETMPAYNVTFHLDTGQHTTRTMRYYVETAEGGQSDHSYQGRNYTLYNTIRANLGWIQKDLDWPDLNGFTKYTSNPQFGQSDTARLNVNEISFYYLRKQYDIVYRDGVYTNGAGQTISEDGLGEIHKETGIKYEANIASKGDYKPTRDGYVFLGWYSDESCTKEYNFDKMPANNVTVYAKWVARQYNVVLHPNDSADDPIHYTAGAAQSESFTVSSGEKIGNVGGTRIYEDLVGWYTDSALKHPYDFDVFVVNDSIISQYGDPSYRDAEKPSVVGQLNLYAKWRSKLDGAEGINLIYDKGEYGGTVPVDEHNYTDKAEAIAAGAASSTNNDYVFSHWVVQKWNGSKFVDTAVKVFPGDTFTVLASDAKVEDITPTEDNPDITKSYTIQLRAEFIEKDKEIKTHITWYDNFGGTVREDKNLAINEAVTIPPAPSKTGYEFKGWAREPEKGATTTSTTLYLTYEGGAYTCDGRTVTLVAADELMVGDDGSIGTAGAKNYHGMYAIWEPIMADYTVHHYLKGTTTKVADDVTGTAQVGTEFTAEPVSKYQDKDLTVDSYNPSQKVTITEDGNEITIYYTLPLTITAKTDSKTYDGTPLIGEFTVTGALDSDKEAIEAGLGEAPSITEVAESPKEYQASVANVPGYYNVTNTPGTLTIDPITDKVTVTITEHSDSKTYNGKAQSVEGYDVSIDNEKYTEADFTFSGNDKAEGTDAATYNMELKPADFTNTNKNYSNVEFKIVDGTLVIEPAELTIETPSASKVYDGTPLTAEGTITGFVNNETATFETTGTRTAVGSNLNSYSLTWDGTAKESNYTLKENIGTLTVTESEDEIVVTTTGGTFTYDGKAHGATVEVTGLPTGYTVAEAASTATATDVTPAAVKATADTLVIKNAEGEDVTSKLNITYVDGSIKVNPAELTVTTPSDSKEYDGNPLTAEGTITGFVNNETATFKTTGTQTDVGSSENSYTLTWDGTAKESNYTVKENLGTLTVTKGGGNEVVPDPDDPEETMDVDSKSITVKYDGKAHTVSATASKEGSTITYSTDGGQTWSATAPSLTDVGEIEFSVKATNPNYKDAVAEGWKLIVTKRKVVMTSANDSKTYDGTPLTNDKVTESGDGFVDGEGANYDVTGTITEVGTAENTFTYTLKEGTKDGNYEIETKFGTLEVTKGSGNEVVPTPDPDDPDEKMDVDSKNVTVKYDGKAHTVSATATKEGSTIEYSTDGGKTWSDKAPVRTDVGETEFSVRATNPNYETVVAEGWKLIVTPRKVVLTSADDTKEYDGTPLTNDTVTAGGDGFVAGEGANYDVTGTITEVGTTENTFDYTLKEGTKAGNYEIETKFGTLEVTKGDGNQVVPQPDPDDPDEKMDVDSKNITVMYDGKAHTVSAKADKEGSTITYSTDGGKTWSETAPSLTDVGEIEFSVKATHPNYKDAVAEGWKLIVTKRKVVMTSADDTKEYDGTPLTNDTVTESGDGFVEGEGADYNVTGSITEVGKDDNRFEFTLKEGTKAGNYDIETKFGTLEVTKGDGNQVVPQPDPDDPDEEMDVDSKNITVMYDGKAHTVSAKADKAGSTITYSTDGGKTWSETAPSLTDVGEIEFSVKATNPNYKDAVAEGWKLIVTKRKVVMTSANDSKTYDGTPLTNDTVTESGDGFVDGEGATYDVTGTITNVGTTENTFDYTLKDGTKAGNYEIEKVLGTLEVTKAKDNKVEPQPDPDDPGEEMNVDSKSITVKYDGKSHTVSAKADKAGSTITYSTDGGKTWSETAPSLTDVGEIEFSVKATNPNYEDAVAEGWKLIVTKRKVVMTSADDSKTYDGTPLTNDTVTESEDGFVDGEGANYDVTGTITNAGTTENTFTYTLKEGTKAGNYEIETKFGTLEVTKAKDNKVEPQPDPDDPGEKMDVDSKNVTVKYDGKAHTVSAKADKTGSTITYSTDGGKTWSETAPSLTDVGEIEFSVKATNPNYEDAVAEGWKLIVTKRSVVMTSADDSKEYDGTPLTNDTVTESGDGFVTGEGAAYDVTGTITNVGTTDNTFTYVLKDGTKAGNYDIETKLGTLEVKKGKDNDVVPTPDPEDKSEKMDASSKTIRVTYDGKAHKVSATASKNGSKIEYSTDGGKTWTELPPSRVNAGTTEFSIRATNPNYEDVVKEGYKLIVDKKAITVAGTKSADYTGKQITLKLSAKAANGVVSGETLTLNGAAVKGTKVGTYKDVSNYTWSVAKADGSDSTGNYTIKVTGTLKIRPVADDDDDDDDNPKPKPTPTPTNRTTNDDTPDSTVGTPVATTVAPAPVPQADTPEPDAPAPAPAPEVEIEDPDTPLAEGAWALLNLILTILTVILSVIMLVLYIGKRKEEGDEDEQQRQAAAAMANDEDANEQDIKKKGILRLIGIIPAVAAVVTFILTEDMSLPMVFTDKWTLLMAVILIVDIVIAIFAHKTKDDEEDDNNMNAQPTQA